MLCLVVERDIIVKRRVDRSGAEPYGTAKTISIGKLFEYENPKSAMTVRKTLETVTIFVPSFRVRVSDKRLETIVPPDITIETMPMKETGTPSSVCMTGQPEPKSESGSPRLMKAM